MGAFFLVRDDGRGRDHPAYRRMQRRLAEQGFSNPQELAGKGWLICVYPKQCVSNDNLYYEDADNFAFTTGTFFYKGKIGGSALSRLLEDFRTNALAWHDTRGDFCLVVHALGRLVLATDRLGLYKVYHDRTWSSVSSSFLACLSCTESPSLNEQSVYEYVFQGATYGNRTVVDQIALHDHRYVAELAGKVRLELLFEYPRPRIEAEPFARHLERVLADLRAWFTVIADSFGDSIDTALSGGYDSRLILAALRDQGIVPRRIHVYGSEGDADVAVAREIAATEGFALVHEDKSHDPVPLPERFPQLITRNYAAFDGWPPDGIFDNGSDLRTRLARAAGGALMLNGGGGEIFRNFFYLRDRAFIIRELLWAFFSQFDPSTCAPSFSEPRYYDGLAQAIKQVLGKPDDRLSRTEVEYLYPCFRCNYWMGRNNAINNRFGFALTPFIDCRLVEDAVRIPLAYKNHGRFEAALIDALDSRLARHGSVYGHDFSGRIPWRRKVKDLTTMFRPVLLRRYSHRLQTRMHKPERPFYLQRRYLETVIDPSFPVMSRFFKPARIGDAAQFARLCTLEYLWSRRQVGSA